jgi:hypothetical protein
MISIRKYLDTYRRPHTDACGAREAESVTLAEVGFQATLAHLATVLVSEIGAENLSETDPAFEPYSASIGGILQRLEAADSPDEIDALSAKVPEAFEEFRRAKQVVAHQQTEEVQKILGMLQQTIEVLSRGTDRSMTRLRRIESQIRSASQISEIVALRERLRSCVDQIRDEAAAEQRDFAKTRSGLERDLLLAQESAALARGGIPGRSQAEQRIAEAAGVAPLVLVLLDRLPPIKARYGTGVSERYFSSFLGELTGRLPSPKKIFRWNERTLMVELPADEAGDMSESALRNRLADMPRVVQVDVGGRVAVLENTHRWHLVPAGAQRAEILQRIEDFLRP